MPNHLYGSLEEEIVVTAVCGKVVETAKLLLGHGTQETTRT